MTMPPVPVRLLLIDDEQEFTTTLSKILRRRGYEVTVASNGQRALESVAAACFDVVLLDVKMPGMDGMQVLAELRRCRPGVAVIMMTGHLAAGDRDELPAGAFAFVLKPHPIPDLVALVERAAAHSRSRG